VDVDKLLVIAVIAGFCLGPHRLASHTRRLTGFLRQLRAWADTTKAQIEEEAGVDIDWSELDPRRYDPRRIIRDALTQSPVPPPADRPEPPTAPDRPMQARPMQARPMQARPRTGVDRDI